MAALKALEIDPSLAEGHAALAATHLCYDWDWAATETELRRALELNPNYPPAHQWYSLLFAVRGQLEEALGAAKRAQELDLLAPYPGTLVGQILYYARRYDQARDQLRTVVERDPNFALAHYWLGRAFLAEGVYADALEELQAAVRLSDRTPVMLGSLGYSYGVAGRGGEAQTLLEELQELSRRRYVPAYNRAEIYAGLGQRDKALEWLARARDERTDLLIFLNVDPVWDSLRSDPRFQDLLRRMNFPP